MSVIVVATITPLPGCTQSVLDAFARVAAQVHDEPGCELYAVHTDGDIVVVIERWSSELDLDTHSTGHALAELNRLNDGALAGEPEVRVFRNVPLGDPAKGTIG